MVGFFFFVHLSMSFCSIIYVHVFMHVLQHECGGRGSFGESVLSSTLGSRNQMQIVSLSLSTIYWPCKFLSNIGVLGSCSYIYSLSPILGLRCID